MRNMATNKNYLMHYRTPGSKNGYTKYPGKYTPIGAKAVVDNLRNMPRNVKNNTTKNKNKENIYKSSNIINNAYDTLSGKKGLRMVVDAVKDNYNKRKAWDDEHDALRYTKYGWVNTSNNRQNAATQNMEAARQAQQAQASNDARIKAKNKAEEKKRFEANAQERAILRNRRAAEQRRIAGGTSGQKTGENYYNDRGYNKRAFDARMRYEKRVKTPKSDMKTSAERNARSTIGNAVHDARTDKDFGSFMKKDIKDRIKKGKGKVKSLLKKWF